MLSTASLDRIAPRMIEARLSVLERRLRDLCAFGIYHLLRVVLAFVLFVSSNACCRDARADFQHFGFPFAYLVTWGPCPRGEVCHTFSWLNLALDVGIWYLTSCLIIGGVRRLTSR